MSSQKQPSKQPATTNKVIHKTKTVTAYREPVSKIDSANSYITLKSFAFRTNEVCLKLFADKFAKEHKALTTARNKYGQVLLQLLKFNRNLGIHIDFQTNKVCSETEGFQDIEEVNASNKYNNLYNELFALELEIGIPTVSDSAVKLPLF